jgi:hypothetical protein
MIRLILYALIAYALYRLFFPAKRVEKSGPQPGPQPGQGNAAPGSEEARRRAAESEGEYIEYEEVD